MEQSDAIAKTLPREGGPVFIVVMGVSGTGKSTLGAGLAHALGMPYIEGDELHPKANIEKMSSGHALDDADREPWLAHIRANAVLRVGEQLEAHLAQSGGEGSRVPAWGVVATCSSLKRYYRDILRGRWKPHPESKENANRLHEHPEDAFLETVPLPTYFVFIDGSRELLLDRMEKRPGHFMKATMLDGQLRTLESPVGEEGVVVVSAEQSTEEQVHVAVEELKHLAGLTGRIEEAV
ncbi:hypothetical protein GALMADRAFT_105835 [Galerina marginata CBS 339.88]|uniref:gluconokinase n=1 Tax=Galerina marginata (strain CBS 339.88) TaxID=685588 RepID=A0A067SLC6_GALM3|nr:hypothetical protein GALMADRAFT_105835 [Galerina marginata CBS 339.88]